MLAVSTRGPCWGAREFDGRRKENSDVCEYSTGEQDPEEGRDSHNRAAHKKKREGEKIKGKKGEEQAQTGKSSKGR